jgi:hypothetical protein
LRMGCLLTTISVFLITHPIDGVSIPIGLTGDPSGLARVESLGGISDVSIYLFLPAVIGGVFVLLRRRWLALVCSVCAVLYWFFWAWAWSVLMFFAIPLGVLALMFVIVLLVSKKYFVS